MKNEKDTFEEDYFKFNEEYAEYLRRKREKELELMEKQQEQEEVKAEQNRFPSKEEDEDIDDNKSIRHPHLDEEDTTDNLANQSTYNIDKRVVNLSYALHESRKRELQDPTLSQYDRINNTPYWAQEFLSYIHRKDNTEVRYPLLYPEDYTWVERYNKSSDFAIMVGFHDGDSDNNLEEHQTNVGRVDIIDINVEFEVNFQKALDELNELVSYDNSFKEHYGVIKYADLVFCIPQALKEVATSYEIRLVEFFIKRDISPRITISFLNEDETAVSKALINIDMILFKDPYISKS